MKSLFGLLVLCSIASFSLFVNQRRFPHDGALPIYGAALFALCSLLATTQAAPLMMSTAQSNDPVALQHALNGFEFWEALRAGVQALTFCCTLWALVVVSQLYKGNRDNKPIFERLGIW
jgi:hypothetical protein